MKMEIKEEVIEWVMIMEAFGKEIEKLIIDVDEFIKVA